MLASASECSKHGVQRESGEGSSGGRGGSSGKCGDLGDRWVTFPSGTASVAGEKSRVRVKIRIV